MLPGITGMGGRAVVGIPFRITATKTSSGKSSWNGSEYTFTAEVPPHKVGDLILIFVCLTGITSGQTARIQTSPAPSGWTFVDEHEGIDTNSQPSQLVLFRKTADEDNLLVTSFEVVVTGFLGNRFGCVGATISGTEVATPMELSTGKSATSSTDPAAPNISLTAGKRLVLTCLACDDNNAMGADTYPGDMDGVFLLSSSSPNHFGIYLGYEVVTVGVGTYGPGNWDLFIGSDDLAVQITCAARA